MIYNAQRGSKQEVHTRIQKTGGGNYAKRKARLLRNSREVWSSSQASAGLGTDLSNRRAGRVCYWASWPRRQPAQGEFEGNAELRLVRQRHTVCNAPSLVPNTDQVIPVSFLQVKERVHVPKVPAVLPDILFWVLPHFPDHRKLHSTQSFAALFLSTPCL